ncbi:MAG: hypothetical protein HOQ27_13450 [Dermatophilaceae bacterium]|nr:hypothetical protein [Dermatophilaceae bacterium]
MKKETPHVRTDTWWRTSAAPPAASSGAYAGQPSMSSRPDLVRSHQW